MPKITRSQAEEIIQTVMDHIDTSEKDGFPFVVDHEKCIADVQAAATHPPTQPTDGWGHDAPASFDRLARPEFKKRGRK